MHVHGRKTIEYDADAAVVLLEKLQICYVVFDVDAQGEVVAVSGEWFNYHKAKDDAKRKALACYRARCTEAKRFL